MNRNLPLLLIAACLALGTAAARAAEDDATPPADDGSAPQDPGQPAGDPAGGGTTVVAPVPSSPRVAPRFVRQTAPEPETAPEPPAAPAPAPAPKPVAKAAAVPASGSPAGAPSPNNPDGSAPDMDTNPAAVLGDKANFVNGIMFVGWSPQDHANGGAGTPKYDAYNYLVINKVDPTSKTWAPDAAAGLNKKYPCKYWAQDGETLIYEDEYIHSAPPGHGVPGGAIPGAKGEFIWGGMNGYVPAGNPCGGPSGQVNPAR